MSEKFSYSVIIPFFNSVELSSAIKSVLDQTVPPKEVILVDDGSDECYHYKLPDVSDRGIRLVYFRHSKNMGVSAARNTGIRSSSSDYIAFLDSDDIWYPTKIKEMLTATKLYPGAAFYCHWVETRNNSSALMCSPHYKKIYLTTMLFRNIVSTSSVVVRNPYANLFDENLRLSEDYDAWLQLIVDDGPAVLVQKALGRRNRRVGTPGGLSCASLSMRKANFSILRKYFSPDYKLNKLILCTCLLLALIHLIKESVNLGLQRGEK